MWDLVRCPETELEPPALDAQSLNNWTSREVPLFIFFLKLKIILLRF